MKNFRDYLKESEQAADAPVAGDTFAINIREECLIESVVVESRDDGVVIAADEGMMRLLESYGYTFEENCMECGMSESDCGCDHEQVDEIAPVLGAIARTAIPMAVGAAMSNDDETNETRDPGEYDEEGDMAKDELYTMIRSARKLIGMLDNDDNMPEWTQKKINKATDYVDTASDYISSKKERGVMEQGVALPDIRGLGYEAQSLILKLRRDVEDKRLQPTPQAVLAAASELAGDMDFAPELLVRQVLGNANGIAEGNSEPNPVARATLHRIMMRHPGMLAQHGPERVMKAVDDVADLVGDMDDIGTSDVSGWVNMVQEILDSLDQGVAEGAEQLHPETLELIDEYIAKIEPDADRDEMIQSVIRGSIHPSELEYALKDDVAEAEYQGRKVPLGKPMRGDVKKSKVYVKNPQGNVVKVNFGDPNMKIKKSNPERRKNFRARHNCDNPGPRHKARYWSCRAW